MPVPHDVGLGRPCSGWLAATQARPATSADKAVLLSVLHKQTAAEYRFCIGQRLRRPKLDSRRCLNFQPPLQKHHPVDCVLQDSNRDPNLRRGLTVVSNMLPADVADDDVM